jgi:hypothetical protein
MNCDVSYMSSHMTGRFQKLFTVMTTRKKLRYFERVNQDSPDSLSRPCGLITLNIDRIKQNDSVTTITLSFCSINTLERNGNYMKEMQQYLTMTGHCPVNGCHKLTVIQWPYVICEYCNKEFVLFTRELVDHFFEVDIFKERLNS